MARAAHAGGRDTLLANAFEGRYRRGDPPGALGKRARRHRHLVGTPGAGPGPSTGSPLPVGAAAGAAHAVRRSQRLQVGPSSRFGGDPILELRDVR